MNKKTVVLICTVIALLAIVLSFSLKSCGDNAKDNTANTDSTGEQTQETGDGIDAEKDDAISTTTGTDENEPTLPGSTGVADTDDNKNDDDTVSSNDTSKTEQDTSVKNDGEDKQDQTTPNDSTATTTPAVEHLTYTEYLALSKAEKIAYYEAFNDPEAFTLWFYEAQQAYEDGAIEIGNGTIDLGEILNP